MLLRLMLLWEGSPLGRCIFIALIQRNKHFRQLLETKFPFRIDDERCFVDRLKEPSYEELDNKGSEAGGGMGAYAGRRAIRLISEFAESIRKDSVSGSRIPPEGYSRGVNSGSGEKSHGRARGGN